MGLLTAGNMKDAFEPFENANSQAAIDAGQRMYRCLVQVRSAAQDAVSDVETEE